MVFHAKPDEVVGFVAGMLAGVAILCIAIGRWYYVSDKEKTAC